MATTRLPPDFSEFLKLLGDNHVEYLLIGGYAVIAHGYPRSTGDLDVWVGTDPINAERVVEVFRQFGITAGVTRELFTVPDSIVRMGIPPFRLEVHSTISGLDFAAAYARRLDTTVDGIPVHLINIADLRINKQASGRQKDLDDLANLP